MKIVTTLEFNRHGYKFLSEIEATREPILVTKNGRPHVMALPFETAKRNDPRCAGQAVTSKQDAIHTRPKGRVKSIDARK